MSLNTINFNLLKEFLGTLDPNDYLVLRRSSEGKDYKVKVSSLIAGGSGGIPAYDPARDPDYTEGNVSEFNFKIWLWINETDGNSVPAEGADWTELSRSEAGGMPAYAPGVYDGDNIAVARDGFIWTLKTAQPRPYTATASFNAAHWDQFPLMAVTDDIVNTAFAKNRPVGAYDLRTHYANKSSGTFTEVTPQNWTFPSSRLSVQKLRTQGPTAITINLTNPTEPVQANDGLKHCVFLIDKDIAGDLTVTFNPPGGTSIYTPNDRDGVSSKAFVFSGATNSKWILDMYYGPAGAVGQGYHISTRSGEELNLLTTTAKGSLVAAINELKGVLDGLDNLTDEDIDTLAELNAILTDANLRSATDEDKRINYVARFIDASETHEISSVSDFKIDAAIAGTGITRTVTLSDGTTAYTFGDTVSADDYLILSVDVPGNVKIQGSEI